MTHKLLLPAFLALSATLFACDRVGGHEEDERAAESAHDAAAEAAASAAAVRKVEQEMLAALKAKDGARLAGFYAEDAELAQPGRAPAVGRAAIAAAFAGDLDDPAFSIELAPGKAAAAGDIAYIRGRYRVRYTDPRTKQAADGAGTYLTVFRRRADGRWLVAEEVVTTGG